MYKPRTWSMIEKSKKEKLLADKKEEYNRFILGLTLSVILAVAIINW